ncbi:MAG TPA: hypothetical protein DCQ14_02930 [Firmicutes bacterium]|nr:hypothetical protein [Bacillota bacterium]
MGGSFRLTRLFGIDVEINISWLLVFALFSFTLAREYFPAIITGFTAATYWSMGIITTILIFVSVLLHELAHSLMAIREGIPIKKITLFIFGGVAQMEKEPHLPAVEFKIALVGPATSLVLALLFFLLFRLFPPGLAISQVIFFLARLNLIMGLINLIPAFPLDGGRVLRAGLWHYFKSMLRATRIAVRIGSIFAFLIIGLGFLYLFQVSLIWGLWYIFLGWLLYQSGQASYAQLVFHQTFKGIAVRQIMSGNVQSVPPHLTLDQLVEYFYRYKYGAFPVADNHRLLGMITFNQLRDVETGRWPHTTAEEIMTGKAELVIVSPDREAVEIMMRMAAGNIGRVLVVENERLVGILSRTDIMKLISMHMLLGTEK